MMAAYMSRGAGVLLKLRIEHRLSLQELAVLLTMSEEETGEELAGTTVRSAIAVALSAGGRDAVVEGRDALLGGDDSGERIAWSRRQVARTYRRDFAAFPDTLAAFERGGAE